jgi:hypothetical protein
MKESNEKITQMRKQAYLDSHFSFKTNVNKYKHLTDPINQKLDKYVSIILGLIYL